MAVGEQGSVRGGKPLGLRVPDGDTDLEGEEATVAVGVVPHVRLTVLDVDLAELEDAAVRFDAEVAEAIGRDPEARAYVRKLEERADRGLDFDEDEEPPASKAATDLPTGEEVVRELEEFLRRQGPPEDEGR